MLTKSRCSLISLNIKHNNTKSSKNRCFSYSSLSASGEAEALVVKTKTFGISDAARYEWKYTTHKEY